MKKTVFSLILVFAVLLTATGCGSSIQASSLMKHIFPNRLSATQNLTTDTGVYTDFALRLLTAAEKDGENTLLSPLSALCALSMTANGAMGQTRTEMEAVLGMTVENLNAYLYSYMQTLSGDELSLANSIWLRDIPQFSVRQSFLQAGKDYYNADAYKASFDSSTAKDINLWVKEKTHGMIPEIVREIPLNGMMYLVNALAFEAEWHTKYEEHQVKQGVFTAADGQKQTVDFLHSTEGQYLSDSYATGFLKPYKGGRFAFVALLPNKGVSLSDYIASLNGDTLSHMLKNPENTTVLASLPRFETAYNTDLSQALSQMGMSTAFSPSADFSQLGSYTDGSLYISGVAHKTYLSVGEEGTRAGAVTSVFVAGSAMPTQTKTVCLDRPFLYMLIDCQTGTPFFIGTMQNINA